MAEIIIRFAPISGSGDIDITARSVVYGTDFHDIQWNQASHRTTDGIFRTFTNGIKVTKGMVIMKGLTKTMGESLLAWFRDTIIYKEHKFNIELLGNQINLGNGIGQDVFDCSYPKSDSEGLYSQHAPGFYNFKIPYTFRRT